MKSKKRESIKNFEIHEQDTGSSEVQISLLTEKITYLSKHFLKFKKDKHSSMGLKKAVNSIYHDTKFATKSKNTILLSPAAASFDQFSNFESRGNYFKNLIIKKFKQKLNV